MQDQPETISQEDLANLQALQRQTDQLRAQAQKLVADLKLAELTAENALLRVFVKHGLAGDDRIDPKSGAILRAAKGKPEETIQAALESNGWVKSSEPQEASHG